MAQPVDMAGYRERARQRLPHMLFEYIDSGSYAEATLRRNVDDFATLALRQRVLRDGSQLRLETELFGHKMAAPIMLAPVGFSGMYARRGEVQAARAAKAAHFVERREKKSDLHHRAINAPSERPSSLKGVMK